MGFMTGRPPACASATASDCAFRHASTACATAGSDRPTIEPANNPALIAPARPTASVPTGIPPGIWTIESELSQPERALLFNRNPQNRKRRFRGDHARQMGGSASARDDYLQTTIPRRSRILDHAIRGPVRRDNAAFVRDAKCVQGFGDVLHGGPIRLTSHDHPDLRGRGCCIGHAASTLLKDPRLAADLLVAHRSLASFTSTKPLQCLGVCRVFRNFPLEETLSRAVSDACG